MRMRPGAASVSHLPQAFHVLFEFFLGQFAAFRKTLLLLFKFGFGRHERI